MNIDNIIVHSIDKEQQQKAEDIELHLRDDELPVNEKVFGLLNNVRDVYTNKTGKAFGLLGRERFFSRELQRMYGGDVEFIEFTKVAMNELKGHLASQSLATGGYLIFTNFVSNGVRYFMVVMLKSKEGLSFDEALELMDSTHLELDKLHFAARIDVNAWQDEKEENDVSFIKGRSSATVTLYFKEFLGIEEFSESVVTTQKLVTAVTNYFRQELGLNSDDVELNKKVVHDYCKAKHESEEPIYLDELSRFLDEGNPTKFLEYAQENHDIPNEFQVDKNKLRRFLRYSGQDKGVSVSFTSEVFGSRVKYDAGNDILTISQVPKALKAQLVAELKKQKTEQV